jgi:hypothetical protein
MKKKLLPGVMVVLACASLLMAGTRFCSWGRGGLAGGENVALAQAGATGPAPGYYVVQDTTLGQGYHLTHLAWRVSGTASGEAYVLYGPATATLRGSGCCCTYLPISVRRTR